MVATIKVGKIAAATGTTVNVESGHTLHAQGHVLQVIQSETSTTISTTSTSVYSEVLSASITPSSTSSKILVIYSPQLFAQNSGAQISISLQLTRGGTQIRYHRGFFFHNGPTQTMANLSSNYLDSPSTTSSVTYAYGIKIDPSFSTGASIQANWSSPNNVSTITLMEIAQ